VQPENLNAWVSIFRDVMLVLVGTFLMVFAVVTIREPTVLGIVLGAGATVLGVPPWLRVREGARQEEVEKWSHLP
jgi:hypothetical protein